MLIGFNSNKWFEKSFEDEYHLRMTNIDITKIEENVEQVLGYPKNILSNQFLIKNQYLCGHTLNLETLIYPHLIILVKSNSENFKERQSIRMTWAQKSHLSSKNIRLAFVLVSYRFYHQRLIQVKQKKYECMAQLSASQIMLAGCNNMVQPVLFANILNITCALSMELGKITQELNQLEYIHVVILHGTLPY
ncbi:unnamed protein product [Rotaria socialis]